MKRIIIGTKREGLDVDTLLKTRLLIQANSGGGKSYVLRKLAEECFRRVQTIIIDPEGEFATLREQFGYVLVGKGGETPADTRSAGMLAEKLLELHASAVCDLYDIKPDQRHQWASKFISGMMNAPRSLWHPVIIIVDEAHKFCPERGKGESEAKDALLSLATAGRKRGFCPVFATQRLGKLDKDAAAELLNVLIGRTFLDVDRDRSADILGVGRSERHVFDDTLRSLQPGQFYSLGPAITTKPALFKVGTVKTTHPEAGISMKAAKETPTPAQVKALLPKLADLPKAAEDRARTEAELHSEIRSLKAQLKSMPIHTETKTVERPIITAKQMRELKECAREMNKAQTKITDIHMAWGDNLKLVGERINAFWNAVTDKLSVSIIPKKMAFPVPDVSPRAPVVSPKSLIVSGTPENGNTNLTGPEQRILNAIAWIESLGQPDADQAAAASLAGYTVGGGAWNNPRGSLNTKGLVSYRPGNRIALTDAGRVLAQAPDMPLTTAELHEKVMERLAGPERKILKVLIDAYPSPLSNEDASSRAGYAIGGAYNNPKGRLRSLGLIDYPEKNMVVAKSILFFD